MKLKSSLRIAFLLLVFCTSTQFSEAETVTIGVATNFADAADELKTYFENTHDHTVTIVTGSTGKLYSLAMNGAPLDIVLSADQKRAIALENSKVGIAGSRFTFAIGKLVFWAPHIHSKKNVAENWKNILNSSNSQQKIAIANPKLAPYGFAATEVLANLNLSNTPTLVMGENVGQTYAMIASGNASMGFVAKSFFTNANKAELEHVWDIPGELHSAINQDAVVLKKGQSNPAAIAFVIFLTSNKAREMITENGYDLAN